MVNFLTAARNSLRSFATVWRSRYLIKWWRHDLHPSVRVSFGARLDRTAPSRIHVGAHTLIAHGACILSHDYVRSTHVDTYVGENVMVGINAIVLPGVRIGDGSVVGAGAVVTKDVPPNSLVVGNPARVVKRVITAEYGRILDVYIDIDGRLEDEALSGHLPGLALSIDTIDLPRRE